MRLGHQRELVVEMAVHDIAGERVQPHLRPAEVLQNGDVALHLAAQRPDVGKDGAVFLVRAVREVEAEHIDARLEELAQDLRRS